MYKISIIIPVYNIKEEYFITCLESVVHQTLDEIQVIIIDDGSTNNVKEVYDYYSRNDNRFTILHTENHGVSYARNLGIEAAEGENIIFVDADDWIEKDLCEKLYCFMKKNPSDILIHAYIKDEGVISTKYYINIPDGYFPENNRNSLQLKILRYSKKRWDINVCTVWCKMYNTSFIKESNLRFIHGMQRGEDMIFNLYALEYAKKITTYDYIGYYYRVHLDPGNRFSRDIVKQSGEILHEISIFNHQFNKGDNYIQGYNTYVIECIYEQMFIYYFNKNNLNKLKFRINEFMRAMKSEPYLSAYKYVDTKNTNLKIRVFVLIAKLHIYRIWGYVYWIKNRIL